VVVIIVTGFSTLVVEGRGKVMREKCKTIR